MQLPKPKPPQLAIEFPHASDRCLAGWAAELSVLSARQRSNRHDVISLLQEQLDGSRDYTRLQDLRLEHLARARGCPPPSTVCSTRARRPILIARLQALDDSFQLRYEDLPAELADHVLVCLLVDPSFSLVFPRVPFLLATSRALRGHGRQVYFAQNTFCLTLTADITLDSQSRPRKQYPVDVRPTPETISWLTMLHRCGHIAFLRHLLFAIECPNKAYPGDSCLYHYVALSFSVDMQEHRVQYEGARPHRRRRWDPPLSVLEHEFQLAPTFHRVLESLCTQSQVSLSLPTLIRIMEALSC